MLLVVENVSHQMWGMGSLLERRRGLSMRYNAKGLEGLSSKGLLAAAADGIRCWLWRRLRGSVGIIWLELQKRGLRDMHTDKDRVGIIWLLGIDSAVRPDTGDDVTTTKMLASG